MAVFRLYMKYIHSTHRHKMIPTIDLTIRRGACTVSWWGNRREGDHWGDLGVEGRIILGWISRRWDVGIWTGLGWPRIGRDGRRL